MCGKYSDNSITDKETLLENAKKELAKKKNPPISIDVSLVELSAITGLPYDHFRLGASAGLQCLNSGAAMMSAF